MRILALFLSVWIVLVGVSSAAAHAQLETSDPAPNARLTAAPDRIRLTFTEPLEPNYSRVNLRGIDGATIETPPSAVDPADPYTMTLESSDLPDGVYTVVWRSLSAADGHPASGSYAFSIGMATVQMQIAPISESVDPAHAIIRALHLLTFALPVGTAAFMAFVWIPILPNVESRRLNLLAWIGWIALGVLMVILLVMQAQIAAGEAVKLEQIGMFAGSSTFGRLWIIRMGLWIAFGAAFLLVPKRGRIAWIAAFLIGVSIAVIHAMFSHAVIAGGLAIAANALHLIGAGVWIGGLIAFSLALSLKAGRSRAGTLIAAFSNVARLAVIALIISGVYATWLQVGTLEALTSTVYGRILVFKLILIVPLLAIAAVNLLVTARKLKAGERIWVGRLRGLIVVEIALACGVLAAAGILTSGAPARGVIDARQAAAEAANRPDPYFGMVETDEIMVHLEVLPALVGENEFIVTPFTLDGIPIEDATRIRLRFDNLDSPIGQSELRAAHQGDGVYTVSGANLSLAGRWRIRVTIARPGFYDTVVDFEVEVPAP